MKDGHGHSASDTVVFTVVESDGAVGGFVAGTDIGRVSASGGDSYSYDAATGRYTLRGSGSDIWGTGDEFHYVWTQQSGDFEVTARVDFVESVNAWTTAGIMIRDNLHAGSAQASLFATPRKGLAFQRRVSEGGTSVQTAGSTMTTPVWLKLQRSGTVVTAFYRNLLAGFDRELMTHRRSYVEGRG